LYQFVSVITYGALFSVSGTDPEPALRDAFTMFDTEGKGKLNEE